MKNAELFLRTCSVIIIAIIIALAALWLRNLPENHDQSRVEAVATYYNAIIDFYQQQGRFPEAAPDVVDESRFGHWDVSLGGVFIPELVSKGFLESTLVDPFNNEDFHFRYRAYEEGQFGSEKPFFVIGVTQFETDRYRKAYKSGFSLSGKDWGEEFAWVKGWGAPFVRDGPADEITVRFGNSGNLLTTKQGEGFSNGWVTCVWGNEPNEMVEVGIIDGKGGSISVPAGFERVDIQGRGSLEGSYYKSPIISLWKPFSKEVTLSLDPVSSPRIDLAGWDGEGEIKICMIPKEVFFPVQWARSSLIFTGEDRELGQPLNMLHDFYPGMHKVEIYQVHKEPKAVVHRMHKEYKAVVARVLLGEGEVYLDSGEVVVGDLPFP